MAAVARLLLSAGVGALVLAVVVGWLLTRAALSPVARITETARHIAATGDYRQRLHVQPPRFGHGDELFFLAATFNDMIARLEHVLESQRRLLADTSHELRNPITIIRGNLALLRREGVPEATRREAVVEAEEEVGADGSPGRRSAAAGARRRWRAAEPAARAGRPGRAGRRSGRTGPPAGRRPPHVAGESRVAASCWAIATV